MNKRPIRSYVLRQGRLSPGQKQAFETLLTSYQLDPEQLPDGFVNQSPLVMEIGFGMGDSLAGMAEANPMINYLGVEVHTPGVGHLLLEIQKRQLQNLKVIVGDSIDILERIPDKSLEGMQIFFPDPWPKKKHHKRRLISSSFLQLASSKICASGILHVATDWLEYAEHIDALFQSTPGLEPVKPPPRLPTKYEQRGIRLGHQVTDLAVSIHHHQQIV